MKKTLLLLAVILSAAAASAAQGRRIMPETDPEQWHRKYSESIHGKHYADSRNNRNTDSLPFFTQNKPQITGNDEEWYEPDTVAMYNPYWEKRDITVHNEHGFKDTVVHQEMWYGMDTALRTYARSIYAYNAHNRLLSLTGQVLMEDGTWRNYRMFTYAYDYNGNRTSYLSQYGNGQSWTNVYREILNYDSRSNLLSCYAQLWDGDSHEWTYYGSHFSFTYDGNNNRLSELEQQFRNGQFTNYKLSTYTYNENNKNDTSLYQAWNSNSSTWENQGIYIYVYDNQENMISLLTQQWKSNMWLNSYLSICTYDESNNRISAINMFWQDETWVNLVQLNYTYDFNNNMLSLSILQFDKINNIWKNRERSLYDYNEYSFLLSSTFQDGSSDAWINRSRVIYDHDDDGNRISALDQLWRDDAWQDNTLTEYEYDEHGNCLSGNLRQWKNNAWIAAYAYELEITYNHAQCTIGGEYYCRNISASYIKTPKPIVAIEPVEKGKVDILVYPNPATNQLKIENGEWRMENVEILDIVGRKLSTFNSQLSTVDVSHLPSGMYFVRITTEKGVITKKVVKN